jgi:uncharacterized protein (TIGR02600 family)
VENLDTSGATPRPGDFDNGPGLIQDGPYLGFRGISSVANESNGTGWTSRGGLALDDDGLTWSPWNQISSAIAFGSFPSGIYGRGPGLGSGQGDPTPRPWQTLLFCPHPASRTTPLDQEPGWEANGNRKDHFGFSFPRDHLWLENFWMPVVEPEHLGGSFATEGKVNLNHQMVPFTWIERSTALHGALQGVRITAIPTAFARDIGLKSSGMSKALRYAVHAENTMKLINQRFQAGADFYRSPSEICDIPLIPERLPNHDYGNNVPQPPATAADLLTWWKGQDQNFTDAFEATGDNTREAPYAQLYPRLTTRSNVFTVHYRVQVIRPSMSATSDGFDDSSGSVVAEQRGSATIERYLPSTARNDTDYMTDSRASLDDEYAYRVVNRHTFAP